MHMVVVTRAQAALIADPTGPVPALAQLVAETVNTTSSPDPASALALTTAPHRKLIMKEWQAVSPVYKQTVEKARVETAADMFNISALSKTLSDCIVRATSEAEVRACFRTFREQLTALPKAKPSTLKNIVYVVCRSMHVILFLVRTVYTLMTIFYSQNDTTYVAAWLGGVTDIMMALGVAERFRRGFVHAISIGYQAPGRTYTSGQFDIVNTGISRTMKNSSGNIMVALFIHHLPNRMINHFTRILPEGGVGIRVLKFIIRNGEQMLKFIPKKIFGSMVVTQNEMGKDHWNKTFVFSVYMICMLSNQVPAIYRMGEVLASKLASIILCTLRGSLTFVKHRLLPKKTTSCPNPVSVFSLTVKAAPPPKNKKPRSILNIVRSAPGPTLFIVTQASKEQVMTVAQKRHLQKLLCERDGPESRGASTYKTTQDKLVRAGLQAASLEYPYAIVFDPNGKRLHLSRDPSEVYTFLMKQPRNFGLNINNVYNIQAKNYPNKSLVNILQIQYNALQQNKNLSKANKKNLNRAYRAIRKQLEAEQ